MFKLRGLLAFAAALLIGAGANWGHARPFTVVDDIELSHFGDPYTGDADALEFSPDGSYLAALTERGRLDTGMSEATLHLFSTKISSAATRDAPEIWNVVLDSGSEGPIISHWRWLSDSSGVAFLQKHGDGKNSLMLASLRERSVDRLSPEETSVTGFDILDKTHFVYAVSDSHSAGLARFERSLPAVVVTGRSLYDYLLPADLYPFMATADDRSSLWAAIGAHRFPVTDRSGKPIILFYKGTQDLSLSPDGTTVVTALAVPEIPEPWGALYLPPSSDLRNRFRAGIQNRESSDGYLFVSEYFKIDLQTGEARSLTHAPSTWQSGWISHGHPAWSKDGSAVLLPGTFIDGNSKPCVAVVTSADSTCVVSLPGPGGSGTEQEWIINSVGFLDGTSNSIVVNLAGYSGAEKSIRYSRRKKKWISNSTERVANSERRSGEMAASVIESASHPPALVETNTKTGRSSVVLEPNKQLKGVDLPRVSVYRWVDPAGRSWIGGLYWPANYDRSKRFPLVIQTHGFSETSFRPDGIFPTAFAAGALAGAGIAVLQVRDCAIKGTPEESACNVRGYAAAVRQLEADGIIDASRVGIIGFSRSCYYVMGALLAGNTHFAAASVTDGVMETYTQYILTADAGLNVGANDADSVIGAKPFGAGLRRWIDRSPSFGFDRIDAPLLVAAEGPGSMINMWEPYAALRYLQKPTEFVLLNTDEHVLTNPAVRLASQGGTVDWFRFWLQGYEEPDLKKSEQYRRWEKLCDMQVNQHPNQPAFCVRSKARVETSREGG